MAVTSQAACRRDDEYLSAGRPSFDRDDREAKELLVDALVCDALAVLDVLDSEVLIGAARDAAELLAMVAGHDNGHVSIDPDSEIIDDVTVTPANTADKTPPRISSYPVMGSSISLS